MKGIITKTVGGFFFVADENQKIHKTIIRGKIQKEVYPGDKVEFYVREKFEEKVIKKIYSRDNLLYRPKVANVDQVLVIQSFDKPPLDRKLLDRFLIAVEAAGLNPLIIINKKDLVEDFDKSIAQDYSEAGYKVYLISIKNKQGLKKFDQELKNKINVTAVPSGVGKTSLINTLIPEADLEVNSVSDNLNRGVHTTRHVELLALDDKGWIADTPGFTSLNIDHLSPEELNFCYPEFKDYMNKCKFNMCSHTHEPGCAVKQAVENNQISTARYDSYQMFYEELKNKEQSYD